MTLKEQRKFNSDLNIFAQLRGRAADVAQRFAASQTLELDLASARLVKMSGPWHGLFLFDAVNPGGDFKELAVMVTPGADGQSVRLMAPGIVEHVALADFKARVSASLEGKPIGQGQFVCDQIYANWQAAGSPFPFQSE